jgi:hypothetical protein
MQIGHQLDVYRMLGKSTILSLVCVIDKMIHSCLVSAIVDQGNVVIYTQKGSHGAWEQASTDV